MLVEHNWDGLQHKSAHSLGLDGSESYGSWLCQQCFMGGAGESKQVSFLPSNTSGSLKKGFAFLVNLSLTHGWTTLLPQLPLRLCQVRWKSRRTLQRDKLQKKRVLLCFLQVCCGWESLDSFLHLSYLCCGPAGSGLSAQIMNGVKSGSIAVSLL